MGYSQWMQLKLINKTDRTLTPKDLKLSWGKRYKWTSDQSNKDYEIEANTGFQSISPGQEFRLACCGRQDASSGTESHLIVHDHQGQVFEIYFNVPWGSGKTALEVRDFAKGYDARTSEFSSDTPALGDCWVEITYDPNGPQVSGVRSGRIETWLEKRERERSEREKEWRERMSRPKKTFEELVKERQETMARKNNRDVDGEQH